MRELRALELECQKTIIAAAALHGWLVHAERASQRKDGGWETAIQGNAGWPDIVLVREGTLLIRELKRLPNKPTPEQNRWLDALRACGVDADVLYVPEEMQAFIDIVLPRRRR